MTPEKDSELCSRYPKIFSNRNNSHAESCMSYGFECDDGWFDLIDALCRRIQNYVDWKSSTLTGAEIKQLQPVALQVKQKFGGLRFYIEGGDSHIDGMISMAESMSFRLCESCGNSGTKRSGGWIQVLCNTCDERRTS